MASTLNKKNVRIRRIDAIGEIDYNEGLESSAVFLRRFSSQSGIRPNYCRSAELPLLSYESPHREALCGRMPFGDRGRERTNSFLLRKVPH